MIALAWLLGPTWCGWVCHLGALQELLFRFNLKPTACSKRTIRVLLWVRRGAVLAFALSLVFAGVAWWERVDPFQTIFNLKTASVAAIITALVLATISLFVYRPFCRTLCPIGMVSGLMGRLPWAIGPVKQAECRECPQCRASCRMGAIDPSGTVNRELCIACGDCLDGCPFNGIAWKRQQMNKKRVTCKN